MMTTVQRIAAKLADTMREMNEAQRRLMVLRTSHEVYAGNRDAAPDTYAEFLLRTSGVLPHEPSARRRMRLARH